MTAPARPPQHTLRQLRQARGWTQEDVARRLGVSQGAVSLWERGVRRPFRRTRLRLADLLGVGVDEIAFGPDGQP